MHFYSLQSPLLPPHILVAMETMYTRSKGNKALNKNINKGNHLEKKTMEIAFYPAKHIEKKITNIYNLL